MDSLHFQNTRKPASRSNSTADLLTCSEESALLSLVCAYRKGLERNNGNISRAAVVAEAAQCPTFRDKPELIEALSRLLSREAIRFETKRQLHELLDEDR